MPPDLPPLRGTILPSHHPRISISLLREAVTNIAAVADVEKSTTAHSPTVLLLLLLPRISKHLRRTVQMVRPLVLSVVEDEAVHIGVAMPPTEVLELVVEEDAAANLVKEGLLLLQLP